MKHLATISVIAILLVMTAGCRSWRPLSQQHTVTDTTYVHTTVVERDTVLVTERDTVAITFDCDSILTAFKRNSNAVITRSNQAHVILTPDTAGRLTVTAVCDTVAIAARIRDTLTREARIRTEVTVTEVPVPFVPWWVKGLAFVGGLALIIGIIITGIKLF